MSEEAQTEPTDAFPDLGRLPRLEWIKINQLRHVEAGSKIEFGSNFNVILGRNGTGKTTLLELASAIVRGNFSHFADEEFDVEYSFAHGGFRLVCRFVTRRNGDGLRSAPILEFWGDLWYGDRVFVNVDNDEEVMPSMAGDVQKALHVLHAALLKFEDNDVADFSDSEFALLTNVIKQSGRPFLHGTRIRSGEGTEVFEALFEHGAKDISKRLRLVRSGAWTWGPNFPDVTVAFFHERIGSATSIPDIIALGCAEMPALGTFVELSQYNDARLILSSLGVDKDGVYFGDPLARFSTRTGDQVSHYQLSYGEKRLLAFLIKLSACPSAIIVDELANGMHHSWIERAVELMEDFDTQAFLTSQDPLLIDCIPLAEDTFPTRNNVVLCEIAESGQLCWRNMTPDEAADFFKSFAVGLERISEIMRSKGLW